MSVHQRMFHSTEHRPRMLKDFLNENNLNSCSSNGFKSLPRKPNDPPPPSSATTTTTCSMRSLIETDLNSRNSNPGILNKTRIPKSAFQTLLNALRAISFTVAKKSSSMVNNGSETKTTVKIKDIMRWKLCRDPAEVVVVEEPPSPTATATAAWSTGTTSCRSSSGWSWSESDFNFVVEDVQDDVVAGKEFSLFSPLGGEDSVGAGTRTAKVGAKEVLTCQEEEQQSPVSVLQVGEEEFSTFDQSLANVERRNQKFMQTIQKFENLEKLDPANLEYDNDDDDDNEDEEEDWVEKRACQLLHCVKATGSVKSSQSSKANLDKLLLDFFRDELNARRNQNRNNDDEFKWEILRIAEDWIGGSFDYDTEHDNKDAYIKDMDWRGRWCSFEEEQEELALEIETAILHSLVGELLGLDG